MSCDAEEAVARLCDRVSCDVTQLRQVLSVRCERIAAVGLHAWLENFWAQCYITAALKEGTGCNSPKAAEPN